MNLIVEEAVELASYCTEELNEDTGKTEKNYYLEGVFSTIGKKNRNGRIYPRNLWEREVANYQKEIQNKTTNSLCEFEHPARTTVDMMKAVGRIIKLQIEGDYVRGKIKILNNNTPETNQIKALIKEGLQIGVSSRGVGSVGPNGIVESFKLSTYDIVSSPSDFNANLDGVCEGVILKNGISQNVEYMITESGDIVEKRYTPVESYELKNSFMTLIEGLGKDFNENSKVDYYNIFLNQEHVNNNIVKTYSVMNTYVIEVKPHGRIATFDSNTKSGKLSWIDNSYNANPTAKKIYDIIVKVSEKTGRDKYAKV